MNIYLTYIFWMPPRQVGAPFDVKSYWYALGAW
jgi:hypothetical protein